MDQTTLYQQMKLDYQTVTNETVRDDGDLGLRMQVVAGELAAAYRQLDFYKQQLLPQTATGEFLARHAATRGLSPRVAAGAVGELKFSRSTAATQNNSIPIGTACTASGGNGVLYVTTETAMLPAGGTSVTVAAAASEPGKHTNIKANAIDLILGGIAGIETVTNPAAFTGGMEAEEDEALRTRLLQSFVRVSTGANRQFYEDVAMSVSGVHSAQAVVTGSSVTLYVTDMFRMTSDALVSKVQQAIDAAKALGVTVTVQKPTVITQNIAATVYVDNLQSHVSQAGVARSFLMDKVYKLGIGQNLNPYTFSEGLSEKVVGLREIVFTNPSTLVIVADGKILLPGTVTVTIAKQP